MSSSISEVAAQAGVSNATVSRTFAHPDQVSPKTRQKVYEAAQLLHFNVARSAGILKTGKTLRIALLIGGSKIEWFTAEIISGLNEVFRPQGYDLVLYPIANIKERDTFFDELPIRKNVDAIIVSSFGISEHEVEKLQQIGIPVIGINTMTDGFTATIGIDDKRGITTLVNHLVRLGHSRLLYCYEGFSSTLGFSSMNRISGFQEACEQYPHVTYELINVDNNEHILDVALTKVLESPNPPTALCFHQDSQAIPFLYKAQRIGIRIPDDLSVTGFDDSTFALESGLTTIRQDPYAMAKSAAHITLALLDKHQPDAAYTIAPTQLIVRNSTGQRR